MDAAQQFARGWYVVSWSHELAKGAVQPLRAFGRHYVVYRTADGQPVVLDAHCPHLGAHLGHGGRVEGDSIVCPFHAWRFGSDGRCAGVPYAKRVPPRAQVGTYPVREHSGMVFMFYGAGGPPPDYEVPPLEPYGDPTWSDLQTASIEIATQQREVIENIADRAHFLPVHGTRIDEFHVSFDGPHATQRAVGGGHDLLGNPHPVDSTATYHGPAVQYTHLGEGTHMKLINAHLPIDGERLLLRFGVLVEEGGTPLHPKLLDAHVRATRDGYFQDVAIWEHKRWRDRPTFADGDGPIGEVRRWFSQFFAASDAPSDRNEALPSP